LVSNLGADVNQADDQGCTPLFLAARLGDLAVVQCLAKELSADVNIAKNNGVTPLLAAVLGGDLAIVRCLVKEHGADVNQAAKYGITLVGLAADKGNLPMVQCLVDELGADVNQESHDGSTPLMMATFKKHRKCIAYLLKRGANPKASYVVGGGMAVDISKSNGAPPELIAYLEAKTHCSNLSCTGAGLKKCTGCKQARYCGQQCQLAHWPAHKADCNKVAAELNAAEDKQRRQ
jgi:hypothetical protein